MSKLLTFDEVAEVLQVTRRTVHNLAKRGLLAVTHVGRRVRVRPSELERYLDRRTKLARR